MLKKRADTVCKTVWRFLKKLKMELPYNLVISLLVINAKKPKTLIQKNICPHMFTAALFTIAKIWKQPKHTALDEWIKKQWYLYTMFYYSATKKKQNLTFGDSMGGPRGHYAK